MRVIGSNHRLTPPSQLQLAVACKEEIFACLLDLQASYRINGAILLATCNRIEIILDTSPKNYDGLDEAILGEHANMVLHEFTGADATHYLLRVATGLESMVRGEEQILGQLREAFKMAEEHGLLSSTLRNLRTQLMAAARETRQRAGMARCRVSVAALAARQLEPTGRRFAIVGAGETGRLAIEALINRGFSNLTIVNRTFERATSLARHFGIEAMSLADFLEQSQHYGPKPWDAVLLAIESRGPIFFARHAANLRAVVDVSMPSVLDDSIREVDGLEVFDLDSIAKLVDAETGRRLTTLETAESMVRARSRALHDNLISATEGSRAHLGQIMEQHLDTARQELQDVLGNKLSHLSNVDQELVRDVIIRTTKRNAHLHLKDVRNLSKS